MKKILQKIILKKLFLISAIIFLSGLAIWLGKDLLTKEYKAIDFSNLTVSEAREWAKKEGLKDELFVIKYESSETIIKDKLIKQEPLAGTKIIDKLVLVYSSGIDKQKKIMLPKITDKIKRHDLEKWFKENFFSNVKYEYVINEEKDKDSILKIEPNGLQARNQRIIVTLSAGSDKNASITVPDFTTYTYEQIIAWAEQNSINVDFKKEKSSKKANSVLKQNVVAGSEIKVGSDIEITLSGGNLVVIKDFYRSSKSAIQSWANNHGIKLNFYEVYSDEVDSGEVVYTKPKANSQIASDETLSVYISSGKKPKEKTVLVDTNHLNDSEQDFIKYIKSLGLNVNKSNETYYSTTIKKGHIYSYDDGEFSLDKVINYSLSRGPYEVDISKFEGKNISTVQNYINEVNSLNGHLNLETEKIYSNKEEGLLFECQSKRNGINNVVACKLSLGAKAKTYTLPNYLNKTNPCGNDTSCHIADGHIELKIRFSFSSQPSGIVISQSIAAGEVADGTSVELVISQGEKKARINSIEDFEAFNSPDPKVTENNVRSILKDFTNVSFRFEKSRSLTVGYIIKVYVNGSSDYEAGDYPLDTSIVVVICDGYEQ